MTAANFLIYAADGYGPTVAFITCSALALQSIDSNIPVVLTQRLIYTLLGGGIALLSNRYIFPVRLQKQMQYLFELLRTLREQLAEIGIHTTPGDDSRRHQIDQLIINPICSLHARKICRNLCRKCRNIPTLRMQGNSIWNFWLPIWHNI